MYIHMYTNLPSSKRLTQYCIILALSQMADLFCISLSSDLIKLFGSYFSFVYQWVWLYLQKCSINE